MHSSTARLPRAASGFPKEPAPNLGIPPILRFASGAITLPDSCEVEPRAKHRQRCVQPLFLGQNGGYASPISSIGARGCRNGP